MVVMFFETGSPATGYSQSQIQTMQAEHIANLDAQARVRKLILAGPTSDPDKKKRGFALLNVKRREDMPALFTNDPYVQAGLLRPVGFEANVWMDNPKRAPQDAGLGEYALLLLVQPDGASDEGAVAVDAKPLWSGTREQRPAMLAQATDDNPIRVAAIYRFSDLDAARAKVAEHPLVRNGTLQALTFKQFMQKGVID